MLWPTYKRTIITNVTLKHMYSQGSSHIDTNLVVYMCVILSRMIILHACIIKPNLYAIIDMELISPLIKLFHIRSFHNFILLSSSCSTRLCCSCCNSDGHPDGRNKNGSYNTYLLNMAALIHIHMLHAVCTPKKPDFSEPLISKAYWGSGTGEDTGCGCVSDSRLIAINVTD